MSSDELSKSLTQRSLDYNEFRATLSESLGTSDFFAPFFDVVFYNAKETGSETVLNENGEELPPGSIRLFDGSTSRGNRSIGSYSKGSRVQITTVGGAVVNYFADDRLRETKNYRASLTIEAASAAAYKATIILEPPYADAIALLESGALVYGALMEIQWGYMGAGSEPVVSDIGIFSITQPSVTFGQKVSIKINGYDMFSKTAETLNVRRVWLTEGQAASDEGKGSQAYPSDLSILIKIFQKHGYTINYGDLMESSPLYKERSTAQVVQCTRDDIFVRQLLLRNNVRLEPSKDPERPNEFRVLDLTRADFEPSVYRLLYYVSPANATDIPMISFDANSILGLFAGEGSRGYSAFVSDMDTGGIERADRSVDVTDGDKKVADETNINTGAKKPVPEYKKVDRDDECASGLILAYPGRSQQAAKEVSEDNIRGREIDRTANTYADVTIPGHPTIIPLMNVDVVGVGRFGGTYRVLHVTHEVGGGYTTKLRLMRLTKAIEEQRPKGATVTQATAFREKALGSSVTSVVQNISGFKY